MHRFMSILLLLGLATAAAAGETNRCKLVVLLADGSRLVGTPQLEALPLQTEYARLQVPLARIRQVTWSTNAATVVLVNGDRLQGRLEFGPLQLQTLVGPVSLPAKLLAHLTVTTAGTGGADLVLHYSFDEDPDGQVADQSGRGNHGQTVGAVTYAESLWGKAIRIRGARSYVLSAARELDTTDWPSFTVCAWVMPMGHGTPYGPVIQRGAVTGPGHGFCHLGIGGPYGGAWNDGGCGVELEKASASLKSKRFSREAAEPPALNQWYHLALTYDGQALCLYVDGQLDNRTAIEPAFQKLRDGPENKLVIGSAARTPFINWGDQYFDGLIDEVRIYKSALSAAEIAHLHDTQRPAATK